MMHPKMNLVELFFNNATTKSLALSILVGAGGWTAHTLIGAQNNGQVLAVHTQQLAELKQGQQKVDEALDSLAITVTRMDGKLDTVNQKIDDDRRTHRAERSHQ
jgi:hypothetical protein